MKVGAILVLVVAATTGIVLGSLFGDLAAGDTVAGVATLAGAQFQEPWVVAATILGLAALFNPLWRRSQLSVDRRFNRSPYDAEQVMDKLAGTLRDRVDPDVVLDGWGAVASDTMQPSLLRVWVRE